MVKDKEAQIREAAIRVFSREGFHRARMETVAHEAGVAVGTIYNYFPGKKDVLVSIFETEMEERLAFFETLGESGRTIPEQLAALLEQHFSLLRGRTELSRVLLQEQFNPREGVKERFTAFHQRLFERIEELIQSGVDGGWVRPCNARVIALALFAVVQSVAAFSVFYTEDDLDEILRVAPGELAEFIWKGLKK